MRHCNDRTAGADPGFHLRGGGGAGAQCLKHTSTYMRAQKARSHARGSLGMLPKKCFEKKNGTIWCILGPILAFKILLFLMLFILYFVFRQV